MKSYTITVNGVAYEVTVEENTSINKNSFINAQVPVTPNTVATKPVDNVEEKISSSANDIKKESKGQQAEGSIKVEAPMPGKIVAVKATVGQTMKRGDVLFVLEAMKMENEIVAPENGTVVSINAASGDTVEAGILLASLN